MDKRRRILQIGFGVGLANFFVFIFVAMYIGGDAINGRVANGHYFLSSHGRLTEVSRTMFTYSKWHSISVFFTHPIAMLCAWLLQRSTPN